MSGQQAGEPGRIVYDPAMFEARFDPSMGNHRHWIRRDDPDEGIPAPREPADSDADLDIRDLW